jgi:hypothetical protein
VLGHVVQEVRGTIGTKTQSLPGRSPSLLALKQSLSLLLVSIAELVIRLLALVALRGLFLLLILLPDLGLLPAFELPTI